MVIVGLLSWWYTAGFIGQLRHMGEIMMRMADYFSIGLLLRTFFAPFRQISAGRVEGPLPVQFRAWADRQFSRVVGATVRLVMIIIGLIMLAVTALYALFMAAVWLVAPAMPFIGMIMMMIGWMPWHR